MRRGITLLEVLISMFILTVGLLSVSSLVPLGKVEQGRGDRIVRASACGRAAYRDMKIRGILDPKSWAIGHTADGTNNVVYDPSTGFRVGAQQFNPASPLSLTTATGSASGLVPVVIDPLGVANHFGPWFPFPAATVTYPTVPLAAPNPPVAPLLPRLTLAPWTTGSTITNDARKALSDSVFLSHDELVFDTPTSADALPVQKMQVPSAGGLPINRMDAGNYSWLATIVPDPTLLNATNWSGIPCCVSVVVFHKRALTIPGSGERMCNIAALVSNGEIQISVNPTAIPDKVGVAPAYSGNGEGFAHIDVRPQQWIMVAGWDDLDGLPSLGDRFWRFRWYRVSSVDATIDTNGKETTRQSTGTGPWTKRLTIEGPDWDVPAALMADFLKDSRVFLFDGIANVYEKNLTLEVD